jgi:hypothetical protein
MPGKDEIGDTPSEKITSRIRSLGGWRGDTLAHIRKLILAVDPAIVEEWKWNQPVWSLNGILCTGEAYKAAVKTTFPKGASLPDPEKLFNSSLEGNTRRAINDAGFNALIRAAIAANAGG